MVKTADPQEEPSASQMVAALQPFDTPTVANAIETFGVQLRNEGYLDRSVRCFLPQLPPMVGYAYTLRVRSGSPPPLGQSNYFDRDEWWEELQRIPAPRILVIEDMDQQPGSGAFIGGLHAEILYALGCVGAVTNGAVRDLPHAAALGFHLFAGQLSVSHAYIHVVAIGERVKLDGLDIHPGDLLHGDMHGVLRVPREVAAQIPAVASRMQHEEREITRFCRSEGFSLGGLRERLKSQTPKI